MRALLLGFARSAHTPGPALAVLAQAQREGSDSDVARSLVCNASLPPDALGALLAASDPDLREVALTQGRPRVAGRDHVLGTSTRPDWVAAALSTFDDPDGQWGLTVLEKAWSEAALELALSTALAAPVRQNAALRLARLRSLRPSAREALRQYVMRTPEDLPALLAVAGNGRTRTMLERMAVRTHAEGSTGWYEQPGRTIDEVIAYANLGHGEERWVEALTLTPDPEGRLARAASRFPLATIELWSALLLDRTVPTDVALAAMRAILAHPGEVDISHWWRMYELVIDGPIEAVEMFLGALATHRCTFVAQNLYWVGTRQDLTPAMIDVLLEALEPTFAERSAGNTPPAEFSRPGWGARVATYPHASAVQRALGCEWARDLEHPSVPMVAFGSRSALQVALHYSFDPLAVAGHGAAGDMAAFAGSLPAALLQLAAMSSFPGVQVGIDALIATEVTRPVWAHSPALAMSALLSLQENFPGTVRELLDTTAALVAPVPT